MNISAYLGVAGLVDVGYRFYTTAEVAVAGRITTGIIDAGDGWYSVDATIPATGNSVRWDSTGTTEAKAREYLDLFNDPWTKAVPDGYAAGTAGKILGDNLNTTVSSRSTQTSVDTIDDFLDTEVAAIKFKTDQLTFTVSNNLDANIQRINDVIITGDGQLGTEFGV
jgi:hypothetical protein